MSRLLRDVSLPAVVAGFVAVLVGFTSSVPLVFAAAQAVGADAAQTASWVWALGLGMALTSIGLSLRYRQPVLTAWSTPGAALVAATSGIDLPHAVGAFIACSALIALAGATGLADTAKVTGMLVRRDFFQNTCGEITLQMIIDQYAQAYGPVARLMKNT